MEGVTPRPAKYWCIVDVCGIIHSAVLNRNCWYCQLHILSALQIWPDLPQKNKCFWSNSNFLFLDGQGVLLHTTTPSLVRIFLTLNLGIQTDGNISKMWRIVQPELRLGVNILLKKAKWKSMKVFVETKIWPPLFVLFILFGSLFGGFLCF